MPRLKIKRCLAHVWPAHTRARKVILLYHSVGNTPWGLPAKKFKEQINWLSDHCELLSLTELIQAPLNNKIQVAITFDDGYVSLHDQAAAILTDKKASATVYVNTGWMGESSELRKKSVAEIGHYPDEVFLTWHEVKELNDAGWEIGSHGINHYDFSQTEATLMQQELINSKSQIETRVQRECIHFAYPWGRYSNEVKKAIENANYTYAAAAYHAPLQQSFDRLAFPRMNIAIDYSLNDFKNIVLGKWDYLGMIHKMRGM